MEFFVTRHLKCAQTPALVSLGQLRTWPQSASKSGHPLPESFGTLGCSWVEPLCWVLGGHPGLLMGSGVPVGVLEQGVARLELLRIQSRGFCSSPAVCWQIDRIQTKHRQKTLQQTPRSQRSCFGVCEIQGEPLGREAREEGAQAGSGGRGDPRFGDGGAGFSREGLPGSCRCT